MGLGNNWGTLKKIGRLTYYWPWFLRFWWNEVIYFSFHYFLTAFSKTRYFCCIYSQIEFYWVPFWNLCEHNLSSKHQSKKELLLSYQKLHFLKIIFDVKCSYRISRDLESFSVLSFSFAMFFKSVKKVFKECDKLVVIFKVWK